MRAVMLERAEPRFQVHHFLTRLRRQPISPLLIVTIIGIAVSQYENVKIDIAEINKLIGGFL